MNLKQTYTTLPSSMYSIIKPYHNTYSQIEVLNDALINDLKLDKNYLESKEGIAFLSGSDNQLSPLFSQAYSGHQFGHFTNLGDGRAVMLGELEVDKNLYDIQLKGPGRTPYSRNGDGKATLYSMLREFIISEALHHLHIPTTRSLAVLKTNELIKRTDIEEGGMLVRVASSHIRVGTFEFAKAHTDFTTMKKLADYTIERHYNELNNKQKKYQLFLREVIKNQAILISKWQSIGFVHGVMNTDNMTVSGESIDYGPCAFLDKFTPNKAFSSIDLNNRYAYNNQPFIGSWNLARFAESILLLLDEDINKAIDIANKELEQFQTYYKDSYYELFSKKLGIKDITNEERYLVDEILLIMEKYQADFTNTFRLLTLDRYQELPFFETNDFTVWFQKWTRQLGYRNITPIERIKMMEQHNPVIIPRNQLLEKALKKASKENDYTLFHELLQKIKDPFNYQIIHDMMYVEPIEEEKQFVSYCGT